MADSFLRSHSAQPGNDTLAAADRLDKNASHNPHTNTFSSHNQNTPWLEMDTWDDCNKSLAGNRSNRGGCKMCKTFAIPHEEKLTFKQLLSLLHVDKHDFKTNSSCADSKDDIPKDSGPAPGLCVPYLQHQNSSFTEEFSTLHADVEELSFASEVFGHNSKFLDGRLAC
jgi:hypothetical protein